MLGGELLGYVVTESRDRERVGRVRTPRSCRHQESVLTVRTPFKAAGLIAFLAVAVVACSESGAEPPREPEDVTYAPELEIDLSQMTKTASGLYYEILVPGEGDPVAAGDTIAVDHWGWLPNAFPFSQGLFGFVLGDDAVIAGFEEGVTGMTKGETRRMVLPSRLGYGESPPPGSGIPSQSVLIFRVDLKGVGTQDLIDLGILN
jgi:hypothetical protein